VIIKVDGAYAADRVLGSIHAVEVIVGVRVNPCSTVRGIIFSNRLQPSIILIRHTTKAAGNTRKSTPHGVVVRVNHVSIGG